MSPLEIDGSYGEGGGQLTRLAMALAAVTGRAIRLRNIRAGRPKSGLAAQHLAAVRAVAALCGGELEGAARGATELAFRPGGIRGGDYRFEVGTAGSIALVLQAALPVALHADGPCLLTVRGGTDVRLAPPLDYLRYVFLPWLIRLGARVRLDSVIHGYYPRGGGEVRLSVIPAGPLQPLQAETPGRLLAMRGRAHVAHLASHIPERMAAAARAELSGLGPLHIETRVLRDGDAVGQGGALVLAAHTERSLLGSAVVAERGVPAERLGAAAGRALRTEIEASVALDLHAADQLLIYAALAAGPSRFTMREISLHARTLMWLISKFLPVGFEVAECPCGYRIQVVHGRGRHSAILGDYQ
ncbi:MAG: RNA 3'-terminal phosphate cyclase [Pseudomonadota bacterium]|nr:RNA 3'-terminal phosphate cyclase [Pseudomonadota bacterium]